MWNQAKEIWDDVLASKLQSLGSRKDIFGLGDGGNFKGKQTMYKISENIRLSDGKSTYDGNYYGEQTVDSTGQSMPHGRGVWVGNDGWIWV